MERVGAGRHDAADPSDNLVENPSVAHRRQRRLDALLERYRLRASVDRRGRGTDAISCLDPAFGIVSSGSDGGGHRHVAILDDGGIRIPDVPPWRAAATGQPLPVSTYSVVIPRLPTGHYNAGSSSYQKIASSTHESRPLNAIAFYGPRLGSAVACGCGRSDAKCQPEKPRASLRSRRSWRPGWGATRNSSRGRRWAAIGKSASWFWG